MGASQSIPEGGVISTLFPVSSKQADEPDILKLRHEVQARTDLSIHQRPPILTSFLDIEQDGESGLIIITAHRIENFSRQFEFRKWLRKYAEDGAPIVDCDWMPRSSLGPLLVVGFADGKVEFLNSSNFELKRTLDITSQPSLQQIPFRKVSLLTQVIAPIENAVVCGYSDGSCRSFFLSSGQLGKIIPWPAEQLTIVNHLGSGAQRDDPTVAHSTSSNASSNTAVCHYTRETETKFSLKRRPCKVTVLGFYRLKNWLLVGYEGYKELTNKTIDGQTSLVDLSPPIALFSIEKGTLLSTFEPVTGSVIFVSVVKLPLSSSSSSSANSKNESPLFTVGVTSTSFHIWQIPDPHHFQRISPLRVREPRLSVNLADTPLAELELGRCVSAAVDTMDSVLFLLFEFGFLTSVTLTMTESTLTNSSTNSMLEEPSSSSSFSSSSQISKPLYTPLYDVEYAFYRLMRVSSQLILSSSCSLVGSARYFLNFIVR